MKISILLKKSEIDYDIGMSTHVVGNREVAAGASHEQMFNYSNTGDESGEVNLIARFEENAANELYAALGKYLISKKDSSTNDLPEAFRDYSFELDMPETFNQNYTDPIRSASHEFIVNRTLFDWYMRTKPDEAKFYKELYEESLSKLRGYLNRRTGVARIKPYPAI